MFKALSNMSIFGRFFLAFTLAAVIPGLVIVLVGLNFINLQNTRSQAIQVNVQALNDSANILPEPEGILLLLNIVVQSDQMLLEAHPAQQPDFSVNLDPTTLGQPGHSYSDIVNIQIIFDTAIKRHQQQYQVATSDQMAATRSILASDDPNAILVKDQQNTLNSIVNDLWPQYESNFIVALGKLRLAVHYNDPHYDPQAVLINLSTNLSDAQKAYLPLTAALTRLTTVEQAISNKVVAVGPSQINPIILNTAIATIATILLISLIGFVVNMTVTRPLRQLAAMTKRVAKGETSVRAKAVGRDEIFQVASSMNNMLDNIVRLIQETQSQRDVLQAQVEKLVSEVSGVGEGNLSIQAEVTTDALGVLADSFNYMVEELSSLVVRVKLVAQEVGNSTSQTLDRMTQLVESGDNQFSQIEEATVEVEQMATFSRQVAERSQLLYTVASGARNNAAGGREAVQQAVEGMGRIYDNVQTTSGKVQLLGERSREINNIVEVISTIAHQTNRLALDAAIQAAMAGENGKGFGEVAADIRRLAERAKDQANMIARIVRSVREDISAAAVSMQDTERETSAGAKLTQEAGSSLELIFAAVEHQAREIENINRMATQELQISNSVAQIMYDVSNSTQQNSASTREASQNMERLARLVEQLRASVEAFKLRENQGYVNITQGESDSPLTVSGLFRTVSATAQSHLGSAAANTANALPPPRANYMGGSMEENGYSFYPPLPMPRSSSPYQPDAGLASPPMPAYPQNAAPSGPLMPTYPYSQDTFQSQPQFYQGQGRSAPPLVSYPSPQNGPQPNNNSSRIPTSPEQRR